MANISPALGRVVPGYRYGPIVTRALQASAFLSQLWATFLPYSSSSSSSPSPSSSFAKRGVKMTRDAFFMITLLFAGLAGSCQL